MLERYCREQSLQIYDIYIDDGYSGLTFDRPAFRRMLADIERGRVNLVLTKDLSRLGRDYIQTGHYTELFFPQHGVRYVALNDGVDTARGSNDIAPFKNILNDMYAKDLSRKVKSAKRARAEQGAFTGSHAPYGYRQKAGDCTVLEINEETAPVVRRIFALALGGMGAVSIANRLRDEQILTPAAYKVRRGERHFAHLFEHATDAQYYRWACTTVHRILRDRVYLGHMVGHKSQVEHYKTKQRAPVPKDEQIVVENTHPPLVSPEDFDKVQLLAGARRHPQQAGDANPFRALLYCGECGHRLSMATRARRDRSVKYYRCMHHYRFPEQCGGAHYIRFDHLYRLVLEDVRQVAELLCGRADQMAELLIELDGGAQKELRDREAKLRRRMETVDAIIGRLYEDFAAERVTAHNCNRLLEKYQQEQKQIEGEVNALQRSPVGQEGRLARWERLCDVINEQLHINELSAPLLHELIKKIHIGQRERQGGRWVQHIRIEYRFADEIPEE